MIHLKNSVRLPHSARIIVGVSNALETLGVKHTRVIGANDGMHDPDSAYYHDNAVDFALTDVPAKVLVDLLSAVHARLGDSYAMTLIPVEGRATLHVELKS
jgi:hypothetical protein